jgi:hypothetical protein
MRQTEKLSWTRKPSLFTSRCSRPGRMSSGKDAGVIPRFGKSEMVGPGLCDSFKCQSIAHGSGSCRCRATQPVGSATHDAARSTCGPRKAHAGYTYHGPLELAGGSMPRSMVGLLTAVGTAMSGLGALTHGGLLWVTIAIAAVAMGLAAYSALLSTPILPSIQALPSKKIKVFP